jgi:hypothetical protein
LPALGVCALTVRSKLRYKYVARLPATLPPSSAPPDYLAASSTWAHQPPKSWLLNLPSFLFSIIVLNLGQHSSFTSTFDHDTPTQLNSTSFEQYHEHFTSTLYRRISTSTFTLTHVNINMNIISSYVDINASHEHVTSTLLNTM